MGLRPAAFEIIANGNDITALIADRLISLSLSDSAGFESDTAQIELDNRDEAIALPNTGARLRISIGYVGELTFKGEYEVDEISESLEFHTLSIKAKAAYIKETLKSPVDKSYSATSLGSLANEIAAKHGYELRISSEMANIKLKQVDQIAESDLNLLTRLARENDGFFKAADNKLVLLKKQSSSNASGMQLPTVNLSDASYSIGTVTLSERSNYLSVESHWFDEENQQKIIETAGSGQPKFVIKKRFQTQELAKNAATAKLAELNRAKGTLSITLPLNPAIQAESTLNIINHRQSANRSWTVDSVTHTISSNSVAVTSANCSIK